MNLDSSSTRRWYQLHKSSWFILALVMIVPIAVNLPYEYGNVADGTTDLLVIASAWRRTETMLGGWPLRYLEIREPDYSESPERDWSLLALVVDLLAGVMLLAIVVGAYEQRRRRRTKRWQLTLSDLCFLMLVICSIFGTWNMMAHRYRTQQSAMFQLQIERGTVTSQLFLPKVVIGPSAPSPWRGHFHAWLIDQLWNHEHPTAARLTRVNHESMTALLQLREIKTLVVEGASVTDEDVAALKSFRDLERLQIDGVQLTDVCVPTLERLARLRFLRIRDAQLSDDAISKLAALPHLVSLDLEGTPLTDRGLAAIAAHRGLRDLNIARTQITGKGLRVLNGHPKLTRLWLASSAAKLDSPGVKRVRLNNLPLLESLHLPSRIDLLELSDLPSLTQLPAEWESNELWLPDFGVFIGLGYRRSRLRVEPFPQPMEGGVNAKHLSLHNMPGLETLNLDCREIESHELDVASLKNLSTTKMYDWRHFRSPSSRHIVDDRLCEMIGQNKSLRSLRLVGASLTAHGWSQLSSLRDLQMLDLNGSNVADEDMVAFSRAANLQTLALAGTQVSDHGWEKLPRLPLLRTLDMSRTQVTRLALEGLPDFETLAINETPLTSLRFKDLPKYAGYLSVESPGPLVFEAVNLPELTALQLKHQCFDRLVLDNLPALYHLDLAGSSVDDAMLCNLSRLKSLQTFLLCDTDITDTTLNRIGDLQFLHHLDLENTPITDAGMAVFSREVKLVVLNLAGTNISDNGLRHLSGQQFLNQLFLNETSVTDEGLAEFKLPLSLKKLNVTNTGVTAGGARTIEAGRALKVSW